MNNHENYLPYVREEENHGIGGMNPGHYHRSDNFVCVVRSGATTEEEVNDQIRDLPNFTTQFHHVIIE